MSKGLAFWIIFLVALLLYVYLSWPLGAGSAPILIFFLLVGIVGWAQFGPPIR